MSKKLRLLIANEYLSLLGRLGERKAALYRLSHKYGITPRSIQNYVYELRHG